ncbi:efflux RND transporter permease subunit [Caulobacter segnis]
MKIEVDQAKAGALGLTTADINSALSAAWGGSYVNDFTDRGRVKKVYIQADAPYRMTPEDLNRWYVRNDQGQMAPFPAFATASWTCGSPRLERYNGISSVNIQGLARPGQEFGPGDRRDGEAGRPAARRDRVRVGPACRPRNWNPATRRRPCMASRSWSCSCCWPPSMRAGRSRWPSSW